MPSKGMRTIFFKPTPPPSPMRSPQLLTLSLQMIEENLESAQSLIYKWDPHPEPSPYTTTQTPLFSSSHSEEAKQYLTAVSLLHSAMHFYISNDPASPNLVLAQNLTLTAMHRLEKEFYRLLKTRPDPVPLIRAWSSSTSSRNSTTTTGTSLSDFEEDVSAYSEEDDRPSSPLPSPSKQSPSTDPVISDLKSIAACMIGSGYGKECAKIYKIIRKSVVDESLYHLGVERLTSSQVQKIDWELLQVKVRNWLAAVKLAVKNVFYSERLLCDAVFSSSNSIKEACFSEVVSEGALNLFAFPENVAKGKKLPEKLFRTLDLYEAVSELWPEIEAIFEFDSTSAVRSQSINCLLRLGEATSAILTEFESAVSKENSKASVPGGGVHPLTRYVMNYLSLLGDYSGSLTDIDTDWPLTAPTPLPEAYFGSIPAGELEDLEDGVSSGHVSVRIAWLVLVLLCKLDGKAERYSDVALSYLFLANNLRYVVSKVRSSSLRLLLGEEWVTRHEAKVKQYVSNYERMGWSKVFASLTEGCNGDGMALSEVTEKFKRFNGAFEEAYKRQSMWVVTDPKLRDQIKVSVARKIIPPYREFYDKYRGVVVANVTRRKMFEPGERIVRFAPDDLGNYVSDLFYAANNNNNITNGASVSSLTLSSPSPSAALSFSSLSGHSRGGRSR